MNKIKAAENFRENRLWNGLELAFKLFFLLIGFLQNSSLTFGRPIISAILWPTLALGALLLLYRVIHFKRFWCTRGLIFLGLFLVSYAVSAVCFREYGWYENFRGFVYLVLQFGVLFAFDLGRPTADYARQLRVLLWAFLICTTVLSATSFGFMIAGYSKAYLPENPEMPAYYLGFMWGRLYGAYWDPNIGSVLAVLALLISVYEFLQNTKVSVRIAMVLSALLELNYVTFSDSRTGRLCLVVGLTAMGILFVRSHFERMGKRRASLNAAICVVLICALSLALPVGLKQGYNQVLRIQTEHVQQGGTDAEQKEPELTVGREESYSGDVTNRRTSIWKSAVEIFSSSPVIGVSRHNIVGYAETHMPDTYITCNDYIVFNSMHNLFFDVLASQGVFGVVTFFGFALFCAIALFRRVKYWKCAPDPALFRMCICILSVGAASIVVMTEIIYVISPISTLFWTMLGYALYACPRGTDSPAPEPEQA